MAAHPWESSYPKEVDWAADIPVKPLYALFDDALARFADRFAVQIVDQAKVVAFKLVQTVLQAEVQVNWS